jgi:isoleucyl-tRNA synthetase
LKDELNVKSVEIVELAIDSASEFGVIKRLTVNARVAGPRLGKNVQAVIQAAKAGDWTEAGSVVTAGGVELQAGEYEIDLVADLNQSESAEAPTDLIGILPSGGFLILDGQLTDALIEEGLARDIIRQVQQARKDADLDVSDRIRLSLVGAANVLSAVSAHEDLLKAETLTLELVTLEGLADGGAAVGDGQTVKIEVAKL